MDLNRRIKESLLVFGCRVIQAFADLSHCALIREKYFWEVLLPFDCPPESVVPFPFFVGPFVPPS